MTETDTDTGISTDEDEPTALLIVPGIGGKSERVLTRFLQMTLEYRYGLNIELVTNVRYVVKILKQHKALHSVYLIQGQPASTNSTIPILTAQGTLPLFIIQPLRIAQSQREQCKDVKGVYICDWESAFGQAEGCLPQVITRGLSDSDIGSASMGDDPQERMRKRLAKLDTLPSLPTVVGRLMKLINDPDSTMSDLEVLLNSEPSIALKLRQVANSAAVAGAGQGVSNLKDAITRLGTKKVGAIAQQIALINSMIQPEASEFDIRRFWGHSLACAIVADRIHKSKLVKLEEKLDFNDYWIAALLHDCGKAVQGFFFYDWFERIIETMEEKECTFYEAEIELGGGMVTHDQISEMMMQKAEMPAELVDAVSLHHEPGEDPSPLTALIHVADNLCSEMGFGYNDADSIKYDRASLKALGLKRQSVRDLAEELQESVAKEVMDVVSQCLGEAPPKIDPD